MEINQENLKLQEKLQEYQKEQQIRMLANKMKRCLDNTAIDSLPGLFLELTDNEFTHPLTRFKTIHSVLQSIACVLTNPEISSRLDYNLQTNAGPILNNLLNFFKKITDNNSIHAYLFYKWLELYTTQALLEADMNELQNVVAVFQTEAKTN